MWTLLGFSCGLHGFVGYFGELLVLLHLKLKWYSVINRRYRSKFGETGLIVATVEQLVFIEVKTSLFGREVTMSSYQYLSVTGTSEYF